MWVEMMIHMVGRDFVVEPKLFNRRSEGTNKTQVFVPMQVEGPNENKLPKHQYWRQISSLR